MSNNIWALLAQLLSQPIDTWYPQVLFWTRVQLLHVTQGNCLGTEGEKKKKKKLKLHLSLSLKQKRSPRLDSSPAKHVTHHRHLPLSPAPHLSVGQIINIWRETDKVFHRSAQLRANLLWCALNYSGTFSNKTLASQKQCHNGAFGTLAPMSCSETLEHLEDPSVINWQPGLEKMSDLSDVQTCGLLNSRAVRLW